MNTVCQTHKIVKKNGKCSICEQENFELIAKRILNHSHFCAHVPITEPIVTKNGKVVNAEIFL